MRAFYLALAVAAVSCRGDYVQENPYVYKKESIQYFQKFVTKSKAGDWALVNHSYPIKINLHEDMTFSYELDVLGEGVGVWSYEFGQIRLYAERDIFVMKMFLNSAEEVASPILEFRDRFGPHYLEMDHNQ